MLCAKLGSGSQRASLPSICMYVCSMQHLSSAQNFDHSLYTPPCCPHRAEAVETYTLIDSHSPPPAISSPDRALWGRISYTPACKLSCAVLTAKMSALKARYREWTV